MHEQASSLLAIELELLDRLSDTWKVGVRVVIQDDHCTILQNRPPRSDFANRLVALVPGVDVEQVDRMIVGRALLAASNRERHSSTHVLRDEPEVLGRLWALEWVVAHDLASRR